jgi:hypothetical protein
MLAVSGCVTTSTVQQGKISFKVPTGWTQEQTVGDFSTTVFSSMVFTSEIKDQSGNPQKSFITIQMRKTQDAVNIDNIQVTIRNMTNTTVQAIQMGNATNAKQFTVSSSTLVNKFTVFESGGYEFIIELICPPSVLNQSEEAYNTILTSFKVNT